MGGRNRKGFLSCRLLLLSMGDGEDHVLDCLISVDQKILEWLINIMFLGEVEAGIKCRFGIMGSSMSDIIGACGFLFNNVHG